MSLQDDIIRAVRMTVSTAAFRDFIKDNEGGVAGFKSGMNPAAMRATDAMMHDISNAVRAISSDFDSINRGPKVVSTSDDFSNPLSPVYRGASTKNFYAPAVNTQSLKDVMQHVNDKWNSNKATPSVGNVGFAPKFTEVVFVPFDRNFETFAAQRRAQQEIAARDGMVDKNLLKTARTPYATREYLPMSLADYERHVREGTLETAVASMFEGATPEADRLNTIALQKAAEKRRAAEEKQRQKETEQSYKEHEREQAQIDKMWAERDAERKKEDDARKKEAEKARQAQRKHAADAQKQYEKELTAESRESARTGARIYADWKKENENLSKLYADQVWSSFAADEKEKEKEQARQARREEVQARSAARKKELEEKREAAESERMKHRVLTVLASGVTLIISLLRRISQSISEIASAGTITVPKATVAIEGVDLSAPLANALLEQLEKLDIFGLVSPLINAAVAKVGEIYNNRMTSLYSGIPEDKQRWYNMIDQAHGLESGTFVAGVVGLGQRFANVTDIEGEIDTVTRLAPALGTKLTQDLVRMATANSGVVPAELAERILNAYFSNYQSGLDALNQAESDPSKRYRSLTENLANLSSELSAILRQMIADSMPGSNYAGFSDYEGWAFASRSAQLYSQGIIGEPSAATTNAAYQWQQSWNDFNATLQKLFDERILKDMLNVLQSLLYTVTAIMAKYIMNESQQMQFYSANRAALEAERGRVDARYSAAELAVKKAFGWDDEDLEAFRKASVKGRGKDMYLALSSRSYTQDQLDALGTWAQALKWQQSLEDEIRSETPIYISSLWSDETFAWAAEGTRAGIASTIGPSRLPSTPSSARPSLDLGYVSSLMPEGAVSYYENYYMSLEKALAKGIAAADAGAYDSDYRFNKLNQVDYMDAFINAGVKLLGELDNDPSFVGGVSFGTLRGGQFRSGNDITRAGMVSLQGKIDWLARNNPELLERIKAQALTDLYRQEGGIKWGPTSREYSDMVAWALAAWRQDVAAGKVPAETFTGSWPAEFNPDLAGIVAERKKASAGLAAKMLQSGVFGAPPGGSAERDAYFSALKSFADELVGNLGISSGEIYGWSGVDGAGFSQQQRNGEMRIILDVKTDSGREEYDITDDFNRVMSGYNTSSEMRISTGK